MSTTVTTATLVGLDAQRIDVETDISPGLGAFCIVGLPDAAVQEAKERVKSALKHADAPFPRTHLTINLAPADLRKCGTPFDLPIAVAVLKAQGFLPEQSATRRLFAGELGLDGSIRPIHGALSFALLARSLGYEECVLPEANAAEAALVSTVTIRAASQLTDVIFYLQGKSELPIAKAHTQMDSALSNVLLDFSAVRGQEQARRALEIAAAGGHNLLMQGPPGSGKTMLARAFPSILPALTNDEILEVTRVHSITGILPPEGFVSTRPFRSPHHSASMVSLVGGGTTLRPGEISLAHRGVLFLDEFPEFARTVIESLRQPLEDGCITVSRAHGTATYPARFSLLAAMNPCPCGYLTDPDQACVCPPLHVSRYRRRLSGPLLDRMDLLIEVPRVATKDLTELAPAESSAVIRVRVEAARKKQEERFEGRRVRTNAELTSDQARSLLELEPEARTLLRHAVDQFRLSARAYFRLLKISRTIADLEGAESIQTTHASEALQYRL